mmetsp:Transcript_13407/g.39170  ORF Transcript_13407/g.39170 Transcript_13407/m.39170 type:complete len:242 (+) Transcript_13407:434-1159(+)
MSSTKARPMAGAVCREVPSTHRSSSATPKVGPPLQITSRKESPPAHWFRSAQVENQRPTPRSSRCMGRTLQPWLRSHSTTRAWPALTGPETLEISSSTSEDGRPPRKPSGTTVSRRKSTAAPGQLRGARYSAASGSSSGLGGPARTGISRTRSSAWRATSPGWQMRQIAPWKLLTCVPVLGRRPPVALWPNSPQKSAGILVEPPMSAVTPSGDPRTATPAAVPPLDPPGVRERPKGLDVRP